MLVDALDIATRANPASREIEPLTSFFQNTLSFNETEAIGSFKALVVNAQMGQVSSDSCLMEYMRCLIRLEKAQTFTAPMKATIQISH